MIINTLPETIYIVLLIWHTLRLNAPFVTSLPAEPEAIKFIYLNLNSGFPLKIISNVIIIQFNNAILIAVRYS